MSKNELGRQRPTGVGVEQLMQAPDGTVQRGDEFHDPDNWVWCDDCRHENPADRENCYNCGGEL